MTDDRATRRAARDAAPNAMVRATRAPYVRGLPELELFPDDASRNLAIAEMERSMTPRTLKDLLRFLAGVVVFLVGPGAVAYLVSHVALPRYGLLNNWLFLGLTLVGYTAVVFFAIRRDMPKNLRRKLNDLGVPVCMRCGYDLRGARPDVTCCTECGAELSQRETKALQRVNAASSVDA